MTTANVSGDLLRKMRQERGWSQRRIADLLQEQGGIADAALVGKWERGKHLPSPFYQEKLCIIFGTTAYELGFVKQFAPPQSNFYHQTFLSRDGVHLQSLSNSGSENTVSSGESAEEPGLQYLYTHSASLTQRTDIGQSINDKLDDAESIIHLAWIAWFASKSKQATHAVTKLLPRLGGMLSIPTTEIHILRTKELLIRGHGLLGTVYLDALQNNAALYHYMEAHRIADEIHDLDLATTYLCLMGEVLRRQNNQSNALSSMEQARELAINASPSTRGHILQMLAYTYGDTGQETAFERAIAEATDLLAFSGEGRDVAQKDFIPFEVYEIRGKINRDLGKPLKALPYLDLAEQSLAKAHSVTPRWYALLEISRAQAYCDAGDITTGVDLACKGFLKAYQCESPLQMNRVRKLLKNLEQKHLQTNVKVQSLKDLLCEIYMHTDRY